MAPLQFMTGHESGPCCAAFVQGTEPGRRSLVTAGADGLLSIRHLDDLGFSLTSTQMATAGEAVQELVTGPSSVVVAHGSEVKAFTLPDLNSSKLVTKGVLPVRALALSPSGATLAVAGDDAGIRLIALESCTALRTLGTQPYTRGLAFDPEGVYLAAMAADGGLTIWDIESGKTVFAKKQLGAKIDILSSQLSVPAWHPDGGSLLAVPGQDGEVVVYERLSWRQNAALATGHGGDVRRLAFSPNGLYLASAGDDSSVVVTTLQGGQGLARRLLPGEAVSLAWHPTENALALSTEDGGLSIWRDVIPDDKAGPHEMLDAAPAPTDLAMDVEAEESMSGQAGAQDSFISLAGEEEHSRAAFHRRLPRAAVLSTPAQPAFQPGATPLDDNGRCYLCFNGLGTLTLRRDATTGQGVIETTFHDTARHRRRIPLITDYLGFSMGSLGTQGVLLACPTAEDTPSTITFRPFEAWASNSDWTEALPAGEEALAVTSGDSFFAVATSARLLRIFSLAGLQLGVLSMLGPAVTLAAQGDALGVVWHVGEPDAAGNQQLQYAVYNVASGNCRSQGPIPLSPASTLSWLGFSSEGLLTAQDSTGELRVVGTAWGGAWVPLFSAQAARQGSEYYWLVECSLLEVTCVIGTTPAPPSVSVGTAPRPTLSSLRCSPPVLPGVGGELEGERLLRGMHVHVARSGAADKESADAQCRAEDQASLKLLAALIKAERPARCLELARALHTLPALEGAVKLATHFRSNALADRLVSEVEGRLAEAAEAQVTALPEQGVLQPRSETQLPQPTPKRKAPPAGEQAPNPFTRRARPSAA